MNNKTQFEQFSQKAQDFINNFRNWMKIQLDNGAQFKPFYIDKNTIAYYFLVDKRAFDFGLNLRTSDIWPLLIWNSIPKEEWKNIYDFMKERDFFGK